MSDYSHISTMPAGRTTCSAGFRVAARSPGTILRLFHPGPGRQGGRRATVRCIHGARRCAARASAAPPLPAEEVPITPLRPRQAVRFPSSHPGSRIPQLPGARTGACTSRLEHSEARRPGAGPMGTCASKGTGPPVNGRDTRGAQPPAAGDRGSAKHTLATVRARASLSVRKHGRLFPVVGLGPDAHRAPATRRLIPPRLRSGCPSRGPQRPVRAKKAQRPWQQR